MACVKVIFSIAAIFLIIFPDTISTDDQDRPCVPRSYVESVVCVCNATYCDHVTRASPDQSTYVSYTSSMAGLRFHKDKGSIKTSQASSGGLSLDSLDTVVKSVLATLELDLTNKSQKIVGFGGSVTDAASINWVNLKDECLKEHLINSYFGKNGLEYNMIRTVIGGCDFSTRKYAYNEYPEDDVHLSNFTLAPEDYDYKIPMIQAAVAAAPNDVKIIATPWSPPVWMKDNHDYTGLSLLLDQYYQTYADYYLKYVQAYADNKITIWGVTTGNEVLTGPPNSINSLGWDPDNMGKWICDNLGPTLRPHDLKILACDDQRSTLPFLVDMLLESHPCASDYIDGIAVHYYADKTTPAEILKETSEKYPDKFIISTEASTGSKKGNLPVALGSWLMAVDYTTDILQDLQNNVGGWIDWNLDLDLNGGPCWSGNYHDAPIIVFPEDGEFVKQPMYYALGHFSKFLPRDSVRVEIKETAVVGVQSVAFETPQNTYVVVLYNAGLDQTITIKIQDQEATVKLTAQSIVTVELNPEQC